MKESFKQKMQENKPPLTFKNTKKNICLEIKREFFFWRWPLMSNKKQEEVSSTDSASEK